MSCSEATYAGSCLFFQLSSWPWCFLLGSYFDLELEQRLASAPDMERPHDGDSGDTEHRSFYYEVDRASLSFMHQERRRQRKAGRKVETSLALQVTE